jgi:hypothetical protein
VKAMLILGALLVACGGSAEHGDDQAEPVMAPVAADAGAAPTIPLCPGEDEQRAGECQTLVYRLDAGYCNRWAPCEAAP